MGAFWVFKLDDASLTAGVSSNSKSAFVEDVIAAPVALEPQKDWDMKTEEVWSEAMMMLHPNPSEGNFNIKIFPNSDDLQNIEIEVLTLMGAKVFTWEGTSAGMFNKQINLEGSSAGQYLVRTTLGGYTVTKLIVLTQ